MVSPLPEFRHVTATARYALIGAGGTGTLLLPPLVRYLRTHHGNADWLLALIDGDTVEEHNLARQMFNAYDVDTTKASAAAASADDPHVIGIDHFVTDENVAQLIGNGTTVLIAADNYAVRSRIERHVLTIPNAIVINGGNEVLNGSCQIWVRKRGRNVTPPLSFLHPEIHGPSDDPALLSCLERAALPGGEQTIIANMASALWMLTALHKAVTGDIRWNDLNFDLMPGLVEPLDTKPRRGWTQ